MTPTPRFERILRNPSLYPGVAEALGSGFPWHTHAASPRSSQALCLSAWAPLRALEARHAVIDALLAGCLPESAGSKAGRRWRICLEASDPDVLRERGAHASAVDVVFEADDAVVCVESKFLRDAQAGFHGCGQFPAACRGFYGPGSDLAGGTDAPCRLAVRDGRREARAYWLVAVRLFRPDACEQSTGEPGSCALHRHYQLARTLFYAAEHARQTGRRDYAALVLAPAATAGLLERQTAAFAADVLSPEHGGRAGLAHYEGLVRLLRASGDPAAAAVGDFVAALLPAAPAVVSAAPEGRRQPTVRDRRRRADADRRLR